MWKVLLSIFFALAATVGGLLLWQWHSYSNQTDQSNKSEVESINQMISIEVRNNQLNIVQNIEGLSSNKEYRLIAPASVKSWKCFVQDSKSCSSQDKNSNTFQAKNEKMRIQTIIPLNKKEEAFLLNHWLVTISNTTINHSSMEIVDYRRKNGSWVTGIPLKGGKQLDFVSYYFFQGNKDPGSLYWQTKTLKQTDDSMGFSFFYEGQQKPKFSISNLKDSVAFPYVSIVISSQFHETFGKGILIMNRNVRQEVIERKLMEVYYASKFEGIAQEEKWLIEVFASMAINQNSHSAKGNRMIKDIENVLDGQQLKRFLKTVNSEKSPLNPRILDNLFSKTVGRPTHFFTLNQNEKTHFIPIFYYDQRKVVISKRITDQIEVIYHGEDKLFPLEATLKELGYEVDISTNHDSIVLRKGNNQYRLFLYDPIFIFNQQNYGLLENPLVKMNGTVFIKQNGLQSIFKILINETSERIMLSSMK
ncbi:hypothetical protein ACE38V_06800 [Cytobacillus sp. Hz8]|uniref:hypothetical protein n=1 Tax=Cytobacillus sp. Hz8 TaxID=3347168 RepID=UPI0035DA544C